ncbi:calcium-dependent protein kinase 16-like [Olea europaea var. sylvestris]|uniref:calcium-dependent protein kinase 16-like n=1 Tax=Olea europaea var. sylvestris TaxID=158386 RepID=UPI000C1D5CEA|nr:calcium-dependent protein kinase 16-like [Olea europaea var. sylvestris]
MESEFVVLAETGKEAEWLKDLLYKIPLDIKDISSIPILCDSQATLARAYNEVHNEKSRPVSPRHEYVKKLIKHGVISLIFIKSSENLADPFTKPLTRKYPFPPLSDICYNLFAYVWFNLLIFLTFPAHPWVREGGEASEIPLDISVLYNMRQFVTYSRLKQFALRALASTLDEEELADLRDQFDAIDVDKNGSISLEEMRQALAKDLPWKMKDSRVLEILQAIDSNTDGLVDFSEFVAATLHVHQLEEHNSEKWQQRSHAAFEKFDVDRDGFITTEELKMHTGLRGSMDLLLEEADIDKDGKISLSEFRRLLRTASMSSRNVTSSSVNRG